MELTRNCSGLLDIGVCDTGVVMLSRQSIVWVWIYSLAAETQSERPRLALRRQESHTAEVT